MAGAGLFMRKKINRNALNAFSYPAEMEKKSSGSTSSLCASGDKIKGIMTEKQA